MATERLSPDALLVQTNLAGVVGDIQDDPDSPDANWLTATDNKSDTVCRVSFPTPSNNPTTGAGLQEFRILARAANNGGDGIPWTMSLFEGGSLLAQVSSGTLGGSSTGTVLSGTWDAASLATADGSGVEVRITFTGQGGSPNARNTGEVGAAEWNAEVDAGGTTFTQSLLGSVTPSSALARKTAVTRSGSIAPSGATVKKVSTTLSGTITTVGGLVKKTAKAFAGSITSTGSLASRIVVQTTLGGSVTPSGLIAKKTSKVVSGAINGSGTLVRKTRKGLVGQVAPVGALLKKTAKRFAGSVTGSGTLVSGFKTALSLAGSITATGLLVTQLIEAVTGIGGVSCVFWRTKKDDGTPNTLRQTKTDLRNAITGETGREGLTTLWNLYFDEKGVPDLNIDSRMRWHLRNNKGHTGKQLNDLFKAWNGKL